MRTLRKDGTFETPLKVPFHKKITNKKGKLLRVVHFDTVSTKAFEELMKATAMGVEVPVPIDGLMFDVLGALKSKDPQRQEAARVFLDRVRQAMLFYAVKGAL